MGEENAFFWLKNHVNAVIGTKFKYMMASDIQIA